jgi:hypothetical protein
MAMFAQILRGAAYRVNYVGSCFAIPVLGFLSLIPTVIAQDEGQDNLDAFFVAEQSNDSRVLSDINNVLTLFDFTSWTERGSQIRSGNSAECYGNLSLALSQIGPLYAAETIGSSGALSLLPTAGALIGAPTQELWLLNQLVPLAGILSMALSLGGSIVPTQSSDYQMKSDALEYGGMVAVNSTLRRQTSQLKALDMLTEDEFAQQVEQRVSDTRGGNKLGVIFIGVVAQLFWIGVLLTACFITQTGSVVAWWCKVRMDADHYRFG